VPAGGAEIPTFLSYVTEKRLAARKGRDEFGEGAIEGVAGPEAANNASAAGTFVPLLALGLPVTACRCWRSVSRSRPRRPSCSPPSRATASSRAPV
jgi:TctA family transporter